MNFNSLQYAIFLPIVFTLYYLIPKKFQWILLFISSYYFYMNWNAKYVVLILFTTIVSYFAGIGVENADNKRKKKSILILSLILCLGVLFVFKYANFFIDTLNTIIAPIGIPFNKVSLNLLLPVGISFYTFQTLSYVIDVYRGNVKAIHHFGKYATFVSFFPQLVAGPIERTSNLLPQIEAEHSFDYNKAVIGSRQMLWGFFKKVVIADQLAVYVDRVFDNVSSYLGFSYVLVTFFFTLQIYCDFSGYSDIALGTARLLDIDLMTNFSSPYFSESVHEFWTRWHISLSSWFRDYAYIPLGGNRKGIVRQNINTMITFLLSGLWHGANWTFVIWGSIHGAAQIIENIIFGRKKHQGFLRIILIPLVFIFCSFAWLFFRVNSFADLRVVFDGVLTGIGHPVSYLRDGIKAIGITKSSVLTIILPFTVLIVYDYIALKSNPIKRIDKIPRVIRWMIYWILAFATLYYGFFGTGQAQFVYFQF